MDTRLPGCSRCGCIRNTKGLPFSERFPVACLSRSHLQAAEAAGDLAGDEGVARVGGMQPVGEEGVKGRVALTGKGGVIEEIQQGEPIVGGRGGEDAAVLGQPFHFLEFAVGAVPGGVVLAAPVQGGGDEDGFARITGFQAGEEGVAGAPEGERGSVFGAAHRGFAMAVVVGTAEDEQSIRFEGQMIQAHTEVPVAGLVGDHPLAGDAAAADAVQMDAGAGEPLQDGGVGPAHRAGAYSFRDAVPQEDQQFIL